VRLTGGAILARVAKPKLISIFWVRDRFQRFTRSKALGRQRSALQLQSTCRDL